ncbi:MAG: tRNA adenosine(34) deaminase TadA [Planctomycetota bacterium]
MSEEPTQQQLDERYMRMALREARRAADDDEVPVGAVIVHGERVVGRAYNQCERLKDATAHAEMIAITQASAALENWRLTDATLYVTLEPCVMCAGALMQARIGRLVYGAPDERGGACGSLYNIGVDPRLYHRFPVEGGVLEGECAELLVEFFARKR